MPALQVRDFPATLYDELKEYAARNHRSIAQRQQIFANFDELNWKCKTLTTDEIVALVREGREERTDRIMASLDPFADIEDEGGVNDRSGC